MKAITQPYTKPFLGILILLLVLSIAIPKGNDVLFINGGNTPFLDEFFKTITLFGDGLWFIPVAIISLFIRFQYSTVLALAALINGILISILKRGFFAGSERPAKVLDNDLLHFAQGVDIHHYNSFPSGHTATAFGLALLIALLFKKRTLSIFVLMLAMAVGYSRIYLAQHFLIDVTAGAIVGCFTTLMAWQIIQSANRPRWMNRKLTLRNPFVSRGVHQKSIK